MKHLEDSTDTLEENLKDAGSTQWAKHENIYKASPSTVKRLPRGYYKVVTGYEGTFLIKAEISLDNILDLGSKNLQNILHDIKQFWKKEEVFKRYNLAYKRGVLLSGPPGTGKTCIIKLLIKEMIKQGGVCLYAEENNAGDIERGIDAVREVEPKTPIIAIMEDLDRNPAGSYLLNLLDGIVPVHNVVFLATANHPEDLDEALLNRARRIDRHFKILPLPQSCREEFIRRILTPKDIEKIDLDKYLKDTRNMPIGHIEDLLISTVILEEEYDSALRAIQRLEKGMEEVE